MIETDLDFGIVRHSSILISSKAARGEAQKPLIGGYHICVCINASNSPQAPYYAKQKNKEPTHLFYFIAKQNDPKRSFMMSTQGYSLCFFPSMSFCSSVCLLNLISFLWNVRSPQGKVVPEKLHDQGAIFV